MRQGRDLDGRALHRCVGRRDCGRNDYSVGVSFDQNNQVNGTTTDATFYVRGGVPISFPAKDAPFETFDYGLVVFSANAENTLGQTVQERWGALTPVQVAPDPGYLSSVISSVRNPTRNLSFTAVGYGTGEKFPIPGEETGPADPSGTNTSKFLIRYIADGLTYNASQPRQRCAETVDEHREG